MLSPNKGPLSEVGFFKFNILSAHGHQASANSRWDSRGWTLQARILSTRVLFFTDDILYFECLTTQKVEDSRCGIPDVISLPWFQNARYEQLIRKRHSDMVRHSWMEEKEWTTDLSKDNDPYLDWYSLVKRYSTRHLSNASDKLPAMSVLASKFGQATDNTYLYGL